MHIGDNTIKWGTASSLGRHLHLHAHAWSLRPGHETWEFWCRLRDAEGETKVVQIMNPLMMNYVQTSQRLECLTQGSPAQLGPAPKWRLAEDGGSSVWARLRTGHGARKGESSRRRMRQSVVRLKWKINHRRQLFIKSCNPPLIEAVYPRGGDRKQWLSNPPTINFKSDARNASTPPQKTPQTNISPHPLVVTCWSFHVVCVDPDDQHQ